MERLVRQDILDDGLNFVFVESDLGEGLEQPTHRGYLSVLQPRVGHRLVHVVEELGVQQEGSVLFDDGVGLGQQGEELSTGVIVSEVGSQEMEPGVEVALEDDLLGDLVEGIGAVPGDREGLEDIHEHLGSVLHA